MDDPIVVFDLGGVMVRVARVWQEALDWAKVAGTRPESARLPLSSCPTFEPYQANRVSLEAYLDDLAAFLGLKDREQTLHVHQSILMEPYSGTVELVDDLHARGVRTGCLSNTNAPHWDVMGDPALYPAIAALQVPGLSHLFHADKPNEAIYRAYERLAGVEPHQVVFFDDHQPNVDAANRFGWNATRIDPLGDTAQQVRSVLARVGVL